MDIDIEVENQFRGKKVHKSGSRTKLLYLAPLPLLFAGLGELRAGDADGMVTELSAFAILMLSAWLCQSGLEAEDAYNQRMIARPPAFPRKIFAAGLSGLGVFIASLWGWEQSFTNALTFGLVASAAHLFTFGIDPLRKKGIKGDDYDADRAARAIEKGEDLLAQTLKAAQGLKDRKLEARVENLAGHVRDMFRAIEEDPRDLSGAKKFLTVYLKGARDATQKFSALWDKTKDANARQEYEALLTDLESSFAGHREIMLLDDRSDLDVEIEVLRDRLKQEGSLARKNY